MPHTSSAKKRLRQSAKRRLANRAAMKGIRVQTKKAAEAVKAGGAPAQAELRAAIRKLDKAASKRVIHPNTAARRKSKLAKLLNKQAAATK